MQEQIVYNTSDDYTHFKVPNEYDCVYKKLLIDLSTIGIKGLKDCKELRIPHNNNITTILNSWFMFQIACASYALKEVEKADAIIQHISVSMSYCCPKIVRKYSKYIYFGDSYGEPTIEEILDSNKVDFLKQTEVTSPFFKTTQFIAIPKGVVLNTVENSLSIGDFLYNRDTGYNEYEQKIIELEGKEYLLYYLTYEEPFNSNVNIEFIAGMWIISNTIYYNHVDSLPDSAKISKGRNYKIEENTSKIFSLAVLKKGHYIAIPKGYDIKTIENKSFRGDWLYNPEMGDDIYMRSNVYVNGIEYVLWYCEFAISFDSEIEVILK